MERRGNIEPHGTISGIKYKWDKTLIGGLRFLGTHALLYSDPGSF